MPRIQAGTALTRFKVLDLSRVRAGPNCVRVLSDFGADVIRIEPPPGVDPNEALFSGNRDGGDFQNINRNKRSMTLNLKRPGARDILMRLVQQADVVVENWRPEVKAKLGLDYESLAAVNPRIILASISGFGQDGPYALRPGFDQIVQGMSGLMSVTGHPGGPPTRVGTSVGDITAGLFTVIGILTALHDRDRTGRGQFVDVAMLDGQIAILENAIARYAATGHSPGPLGARHPSITPFAAYSCADAPIVIAAGNDQLFACLCAALGLPGDDPRFASNDARTAHAEELAAVLEGVLLTAPVAHWLPRLEAAGVPCGPLNNIGQALANPQVKARNMVVHTALPDGTPLIAAGNPVKLSAHADSDTRAPAPVLDGDRAAILKELGL